MQAILRTLTMIVLLAPVAILSAQENLVRTHNQFLYEGLKYMLLHAAEKMPEEKYAYKPTNDVRTFGQIVGHAADAQYTFCSMAFGEKNPALKIEQTKTTKDELIAALKDAFAYCDKKYAGLTDAAAAETIKAFGTDTPRLGVLAVNQLHGSLHYGNLITYLRLNDIVPPTSEPEFGAWMRAKMKKEN